MPTEAGSRCALQVARKRRLNVFPDRFGLEQDICDVTLWLAEKYGLSRVRVYVDRHYIQVGRKMAGVTVMTAPRHPEQLTEAAHRVFLALGYTIEDNHRAKRAIGVQRNEGTHATIKSNARIYANYAQALYRLARASAGLAIVPDFLARGDFEAGTMKYALPNWELRSIDVFATWPADAPKHGLIHLALHALSQTQS